MRIDILGIGFDNVSFDEALDKGYALLTSDAPSYIVTPNSEIVYDSLTNSEYAGILNGAGLVLPDGIGVIYASRILGRPLKQKVAGIDFGKALAGRMAETGKKLYLFGSKPGIAEAAAEKLVSEFPDLIICGCHNGYFSDDGPIIEDIRNSGADCVFVCLGAPKQELWMHEHLHDTGAKLMIGLGGSLDGFAGTVKRAPDIFIKLGLEWFYRLIKEPWRFKRMLRLPKFLWKAIVTAIKERTGKK